MFSTEVSPFLFSILQPAERDWLEKSVSPTGFVLAPRKIRRCDVFCTERTVWANQAARQAWTLDQWARIWIVTQLSTPDIHRLFDTAEMREWAVLVTALPYLENPETWLLRATDAVRSNIGDVLDAIAFHNPYPSRYFPEAAWNQLILKVLFNDKPLSKIQGLEGRQNPALAHDIILLANERWAAGRELDARAWQWVAPFPSPEALAAAEILAKRPKLSDQRAAQLLQGVWQKATMPTTFSWQDLI